MSVFKTGIMWLCIAIMSNGFLNIATAEKANVDLVSTEKRTLFLHTSHRNGIKYLEKFPHV